MGTPFDTNTLWALAAIVIGLSTMVFYTRDILSGKTKPSPAVFLLLLLCPMHAFFYGS